MNLTQEQSDVLQGIMDSLQSGSTLVTVGGYAGTGKTTIIRTLLSQLSSPHVAAFTGKATNVLQRKGVSSATTIHRMMYDLIVDESGRPVLNEWGALQFRRKPSLPFSHIIFDEGSMIGQDLFYDAASYNIPIIVFGDHGQLPPVGDPYSLMDEPQFRLETIHRNAGEICRFAEHLRQGHPSTSFLPRDQSVVIDPDMDYTQPVDQFICGMNRSRKFLNYAYRVNKNLPPERPVLGDRIIVLSNYRQYNVFNGMQGTITSIHGEKITFELPGIDETRTVPVNFKSFNTGHKSPYKVPVCYAYCITCHKSQGDEWDSVGVFEETCNAYWDQARWNYTAASRARTRLVWNPCGVEI